MQAEQSKQCRWEINFELVGHVYIKLKWRFKWIDPLRITGGPHAYHFIFINSHFQTYLVGQAMSLAGPDIMEPTTKFNNYRIYGTFLLVKPM